VDVGETLRLVPFWERGIHKTDRLEIIIDPGPAFGIGDHPTTIMALEYLEQGIKGFQGNAARPSMLDVGAGTGVLAIAGMALGTGLTIGLDIDSSAVFAARRNLQLNAPVLSGNDLGSASFFVGGVQSIAAEFEIVAANLAAPTLLKIREDLAVCTGSLLVLSGIAEVMSEEVISAYNFGGLRLETRQVREGWAAALFVRKDPD
jgi:ribosomal protein L11 methyltransferase